MGIVSGISDFFGLDIGTSAIRIVQLGTAGRGGLKPLIKYAHMPVDARLVMSDAEGDQQKLMQQVKQLINESKVGTNNVVVGLSSSRVFSTVLDMDRLSKEELGKAIYYQADSIIPTPPKESKIDWALLGDSPKDKTKIEVLITSVTNTHAEARLDHLESIGLNVLAFEPDSIAMARALIAPDSASAQVVLDIGSKATDLVIVLNGAPRLIRAIPTGSDSIIKAASQNLSISEEQAHQFVFKFGLSKDKLEGQVRSAILSTIDLITSEIEKSIKFFSTRYAGIGIEKIVVTGGASSLPEFPVYVASKFNINVEIGNAWRNVAFPVERQNELLALSNNFSVAVGLALRQE